MSNAKRHKRDTKTFEEETFSEQAKSITIKVVWFLAATRNHMRKCAQEKGSLAASEVPRKVARQLREMADRVEAIQAPSVTTVSATVIDK